MPAAPDLSPVVSLELRATMPTPDGPLEVVAMEVDGRWWVAARCGEWHGFGIGPQLRSAADAALTTYADGVGVNPFLRP